jgi:phosphotransferase system enzyme I (PtsP)
LRALRLIQETGRRHGKPVTLCGEMAGNPLEAMALIGLGYRSISMAAAAIGPVKAMVRSVHLAKLESVMDTITSKGGFDVRERLKEFAMQNDVEV